MKRLILLLPLLASSRAHADLHLQVDWELALGREDIMFGARLETDGPRLFLGNWDGFYMSRDHGYTWRLTLPDREITAIAVSGNAVYAGTSKHGLFRSDSRGVTWKNKSAGFRRFNVAGRPPQYSSIVQIVVTRSGTVIAGKYRSGTYISFNRGDSWDDIYDDWLVEQSHRGYNIWSMTEFDGYLWAATSTGNIVRSPDKGKT